MITSDDILHHDEARTWRQSHQASQKLPKNKITSKTEYTNTQQDLPEEGIKYPFH